MLDIDIRSKSIFRSLVNKLQAKTLQGNERKKLLEEP